ncbi:MAG TPA: hypothetical protein VGG85_20345 [Terracidiphilus sp.]|jgi:hypothetical protein
MIDNSKMKLGRKAIKTDSRTLALGDYLTSALPAPPPAKDWTCGITNWGMMLNDKLGCCTIAGVGHAIQVWSACTGGEVTVADSVIESFYEQWDGYNPADPNTDNGGIELDVLNDWRKTPVDGHNLLAFADPKVSNLVEVRQSITLFGGVYIGVGLPVTAQNQDVWDVVPNSGANGKKGSWGGHCVFVPKYDEHGFTCITWGGLKTMTLNFWKKYVDEAHTLFGQNWLSAKGSAAGFDQTQLQTDLSCIK